MAFENLEYCGYGAFCPFWRLTWRFDSWYAKKKNSFDILLNVLPCAKKEN